MTFLYDWGDKETTEQTTHRIDGHPDMIQGDMYLQCQLVTNGLYCGDATAYNHPLRKELEAHGKDWHLLLQLDSEEDLGYMWGDSGKLYFWIRKEDCKNKKNSIKHGRFYSAIDYLYVTISMAFIHS